MKAFRDRNPAVVGLCSVAAVLAAVVVAFAAGRFHWLEDAYTVRAVFADAAGLNAGDPVRMAGVRVGRVTGVAADRAGGRVVVSFVVDRGVRLGPDPTAEIALANLLGPRFIRLGGPVVPPYLADRPARSRVIPMARTRTPFDVFELTKVATRTAEATDTPRLNRLVGELAEVTQGKHEQVARLVDGIARLSDAVNARDTQLRELLDRADQLTGTLAGKDRTLVTLLDHSQVLLGLVQRRQDDIAAALHNGSQAVGELAGVLDRDRGAIDDILTGLHPTVDTLERRQADLDRALTLVGPGILGVSRGVDHGPWADIYIRDIGPSLVCLLARSRGQQCPLAP
jgi:phospholipid/cholesterol/gamma-HCH transport system substrate-binding protein